MSKPGLRSAALSLPASPHIMLQLRAAAAAPACALLPARCSPRAARASPLLRRAAPRRAAVVAAAAKKGAPPPAPEPAELTSVQSAIVYAALVTLPVTFWSEVTLFNTGAGLQGDVLGGIEGVSYLVLLAVLGISAQKKSATGVGLEGLLPGALRCAAFARAGSIITARVE